MLKNRMSAVATVAPLFHSAETSNDLAAADAADCYAALLRARVDNRLSVTTGVEMIGKMFEAIKAQQHARDLMREAHLTTPEVIRSMGLERMYGDSSPCPPTDNPFTSAEIVSIPKAVAA
jgi:hypothetical protein